MSVREDLALFVLRNLQNGGFQRELSERISEAVLAMQDTNKQAKIDISLTFKPKGNTGQYFIESAIKDKLPMLERPTTVMFGTPDGNLQMEDPAQQRFPFGKNRDEQNQDAEANQQEEASNAD